MDSDHLPFRYYVPPPKTCAPRPKRRPTWVIAAILVGVILVVSGALAGIQLFG